MGDIGLLAWKKSVSLPLVFAWRNVTVHLCSNYVVQLVAGRYGLSIAKFASTVRCNSNPSCC